MYVCRSIDTAGRRASTPRIREYLVLYHIVLSGGVGDAVRAILVTVVPVLCLGSTKDVNRITKLNIVEVVKRVVQLVCFKRTYYPHTEKPH